MTEKIEPALTAEEWHEFEVRNGVGSKLGVGRLPGTIEVEGGGVFSSAAAIALANDALPDSDPRKITPTKVHLLRALFEASDDFSGWDSDIIAPFIKGLEAYLPPAAEPVQDVFTRPAPPSNPG